jgi:hypothetical protein
MLFNTKTIIFVSGRLEELKDAAIYEQKVRIKRYFYDFLVWFCTVCVLLLLTNPLLLEPLLSPSASILSTSSSNLLARRRLD